MFSHPVGTPMTMFMISRRAINPAGGLLNDLIALKSFGLMPVVALLSYFYNSLAQSLLCSISLAIFWRISSAASVNYCFYATQFSYSALASMKS